MDILHAPQIDAMRGETCCPISHTSPQQQAEARPLDSSTLSLLECIEEEYAGAECVSLAPQPTSTPSKRQQQQQDTLDDLLCCIDAEFVKRQDLFTTTVEAAAEQVKVTEEEPRYDAQFNADGRPVSHPFPDGVLPPRAPLQSLVSEFVYPCVVTEQQIEAQLALTPLGQRPLSHREMATPHVPLALAQTGAGFLAYAASRNRDTPQKHAVSQAALDFYRRFGVHICDEETKQPVNWRTVFYVVDFMRRLPTAECYLIEEQPFVDFAGLDTYDFENWHVKQPHALRLFAIALETGDDESLVCQLDRYLRFMRSNCEASHCVTFHRTSERDDAPPESMNQALAFIDYAIPDSASGCGWAVYTAWLNIGLNADVVKDLQRTSHAGEEYYDGPACATCRKHHCQLSYCNVCKCVQYCSLKCRKQDRKKHKKLCLHKRDATASTKKS
jgi:hypothetical protein